MAVPIGVRLEYSDHFACSFPAPLQLRLTSFLLLRHSVAVSRLGFSIAGIGISEVFQFTFPFSSPLLDFGLRGSLRFCFFPAAARALDRVCSVALVSASLTPHRLTAALGNVTGSLTTVTLPLGISALLALARHVQTFDTDSSKSPVRTSSP